MQKYINQLITDLEEAAQQPPSASFIEIPPHFSGLPEDAELALTPYKSIEKWTGIKQEVFPDSTQLQGKQWDQVNEAIFKVFESLNLDLVDVPPDYPRELLYETLTTNWDHPVQYLSLSGMDLELCTGDPLNCPYGKYCDCGMFEDHPN